MVGTHRPATLTDAGSGLCWRALDIQPLRYMVDAAQPSPRLMMMGQTDIRRLRTFQAPVRIGTWIYGGQIGTSNVVSMPEPCDQCGQTGCQARVTRSRPTASLC